MNKTETNEIVKPQIDRLLNVIRTWMETESGPTMAKFSDPELKVQVTIKGYKKIILERTFDGAR